MERTQRTMNNSVTRRDFQLAAGGAVVAPGCRSAPMLDLPPEDPARLVIKVKPPRASPVYRLRIDENCASFSIYMILFDTGNTENYRELQRTTSGRRDRRGVRRETQNTSRSDPSAHRGSIRPRVFSFLVKPQKPQSPNDVVPPWPLLTPKKNGCLGVTSPGGSDLSHMQFLRPSARPSAVSASRCSFLCSLCQSF